MSNFNGNLPQNGQNGMPQSVSVNMNMPKNYKVNKIVKVTLFGGFLSIFQSPNAKAEKIIMEMNSQGWNYGGTIPTITNPLFFIVMGICLTVTFGIWCPMPAYMMVFEREI